MVNYIKLMRPAQWIKNLFIVLPIFFAGQIFNAHKLQDVLYAFIIFSMTSSSMYIINDILDRKQDLNHSVKKNRPIASGEIKIFNAILLSVVLILISAVLLRLLVPQILWFMLAYILLNLLYTFYLKHIVIIDIMCISFFYLLRVLVGGVAGSVPISSWIILCVIFLTLFIALVKRKAEYCQSSKRKVLNCYNESYIDKLIIICATLGISSYGLYTVLVVKSSLAIYSIMFILFVFFRYLMILDIDAVRAEFPEKLVIRDPAILSSIICWGIFMYIIFYH
ncbi:MAG: decaprenyl-phosphate phosphoribosyltransferase [Flavobacterium sp.]|nr:decaprenyl-phosphate phosphoribosyltransferase [Flavobacterium sp.]